MTLEIWISITSAIISIVASFIVAILTSKLETNRMYIQMRHDDSFKKAEMYQQICLQLRNYAVERTIANNYALLITVIAAQATASDEEFQILDEIKEILLSDEKLDPYRLGTLSKDLLATQYRSFNQKKHKRRNCKRKD